MVINWRKVGMYMEFVTWILKCITDLWQNWISDDLMALSSKVMSITVKLYISNLVTVVQQIPYILLTRLYLVFPEIRLWVFMICIKKKRHSLSHTQWKTCLGSSHTYFLVCMLILNLVACLSMNTVNFILLFPIFSDEVLKNTAMLKSLRGFLLWYQHTWDAGFLPSFSSVVYLFQSFRNSDHVKHL